MFKFIIGGRRRAGMTKAEYENYLTRVHGGKVIAQPEPTILRYVQTHIFDGAYGTAKTGWHPAPDFDSMTELWFEDGAAMQRELASEHYVKVVKPDEAGFADPSRTAVMGVSEEEEPVTPRLNGNLKVMRFLKRAPGTSRDDFFFAWRTESKRLARLPGLGEKICRLVRNVSLGDAQGQVAGDFVHGSPVNAYDGVESLWFDGLEDFSGLGSYRAAIETSSFDMALNRTAEMLLIGQERSIIPRC